VTVPPAISWPQGFHKILKKHDKMLPHAPCQQFYVAHLHQQKWVQVRGEQKDPGADGSHYSLCDGPVAAASLSALVYHIPLSIPLHLPRALACCVPSGWFMQHSQLMLVLPRFWRRARAATSWCGCPTCTRSCAATPAALRTRTLPRCADHGVYSLGVSKHMRGAPAVPSTRR